ncbi:hypothetical protein HWI79_2333 [Cryptosporidium felis]|nr:hypothetical protein HWI79_2333 [Cryptosporidium felis]
MSDNDLFTLEGFNRLRAFSLDRMNKAINSSKTILESARSSFRNIPKSYKLLELVPGAVEAPKRDEHAIDDLTMAISEKYSSRVKSKLKNKKKDLEIKKGINGMIKDWNIVEGGGNGEADLGDSQFKDFVTEAKAAEFVIKFLDRMQSKKYAMNYDNVSLHVKGETQLDRQLSAYPLFVSTISHASMGLSGSRRDGSSPYEIVGNGGETALASAIGNFKKNKQIFDRSPLVQLSLELERDNLLEKAPSWSSKFLPSIGTKLDYQTFPEEKALGVFSKDQVSRDAIIYRQMRLAPSAGIRGRRFSSTEHPTAPTPTKDTASLHGGDTPSSSQEKKLPGNPNSTLQIATDLNKVPLSFPWILEELPINQSFKNQFLLFNESSTTNKNESKEESVKKTFYQKAKGLSASTLHPENVVKAIVSNRGVAMVRNITNIPADSNLEAYFDELDDNCDNDNRFLWEDDPGRKNQETKEIGVQKYMEETSYDSAFDKKSEDLESLMKNLEAHYSQLKSENSQNCHQQQVFGGTQSQAQILSNLEADSKEYRELHTSEHSRKQLNALAANDGESNKLLADLNSFADPEVKIEYDLSELYSSERELYRGEGREKTWRTYFESLRDYQKAVDAKKSHLEGIHYNMSPSKKNLNGSQSRKSKVPKSFLPIHESLQQEDDPQEEYYHFVQGQRMIKESLNKFPIQSHASSNKTIGESGIPLVGLSSKGYIRGLEAVRGGRRIHQRLMNDRSRFERELRARKEDLSFLEYSDRDRAKFLHGVRLNNESITKMVEMEDKMNTKVRVASRGRLKRVPKV